MTIVTAMYISLWVKFIAERGCGFHSRHSAVGYHASLFKAALTCTRRSLPITRDAHLIYLSLFVLLIFIKALNFGTQARINPSLYIGTWKTVASTVGYCAVEGEGYCSVVYRVSAKLSYNLNKQSMSCEAALGTGSIIIRQDDL